MRTNRIVALAALCATTLLATPAIGVAADRIVFGTDWRAQAEHGGFYQALATGLYRDRGLDVVVRPGGPQAVRPGRTPRRSRWAGRAAGRALGATAAR